MTSALLLFATVGAVIVSCFVLSALSGIKFWTIFSQITMGFPGWVSTLITWPVVALLFVIIFRGELNSILNQCSTLISKIRSGKFAGAEFEVKTQSKSEIQTPEQTIERLVTAEGDVAHNPAPAPAPARPAIAEAPVTARPVSEEALNTEHIARTQTGIPDLRMIANHLKRLFGVPVTVDADEKKLDALVVITAATTIQLAYERNYRLIFGSQLSVMDKIRLYGPMSYDEASKIYNGARLVYSEVYKSYSFADWLGFLKVNNLCAQNAETGILTLTEFGDGFLKYLFAQKVTFEKPA